MGMFDTITCHAPLPFPDALSADQRATLQAGDYQTKDLGEGLGRYELRADGTLWEWVHPPFDAEATFGEAGWRPATSVLGHVHFYTGVGRESSGWIEFKATIVDGKMHRPIELAHYRPLDEAVEAERRAQRAEWLKGLGLAPEARNDG